MNNDIASAYFLHIDASVPVISLPRTVVSKLVSDASSVITGDSNSLSIRIAISVRIAISDKTNAQTDQLLVKEVYLTTNAG